MDDQLSGDAAPPGKAYAMTGKVMLAAIVALFGIIIFLVALHLYARWYLSRLHRRPPPRRRRRRRTHIVFYADNLRTTRAVADRGLPPEVLKSLPVSLYSAASDAAAPLPECAVCLSEFEENEVVRHLPKCDHSFHIECIDMWFRSHSTCPLCRSAVEATAEDRAEPAVEVASAAGSETNESEPDLSSGSGMCAVCQHEEAELTQSSPGTRLLSLKRLLSMGKKSPAGGGGLPPQGAGTSRAASELDLERGPTEL